ncbi:myosin-like protein [Scheffersomyces stipitis CBS 6054]|uniref:Myosin-like protein n=1 Tax=Scheffersomyces stipitis (strain ATCC 58785 / CBS 6054 / NBRC 10063 / NRRL Y-11545) TaxID=322104 RepID=A3GFU5_PICST|nr:myosin-like protein [Scheffersomyces stipitis CBS 6054]EAZ63820.2 myosin-like protein [Scheffersomyces stipitis CBS 6054]
MSSLIDDLVNICWSRISRSSSSDSIFVSQVLGLLSEIESTLGVNSLLKNEELKLLKQMIQATPSMRLHKKEFQEFIMRLVKYPNFEVFLYERCRISMDDLRRIMNVPFKGPNPPTLSPLAPREIKNTANEARISHSRYFDHKENVSPNHTNKQLKSPPESPSLDYRYTKLQSELNFKDEQLRTKESEYTRANLEYRKLVDTNSTQLKRIRDLESEVSSINKYVQSLEEQLSRQSGDRNSNSLASKIKDRDRTIRSLEQLSNEYRNELKNLEEDKLKSENSLAELVTSLREQDNLIKNLQLKLSLTGESLKIQSQKADPVRVNSQLQDFLLNLPFLKQYYYFYKYKNNTRRLFIVNMFAMILATIIVLHVAECVLYFSIWFFTSKPNSSMYLYNNFDNEWYSTESTFVWWKEIETLEYFVSTISEWFTT